LLINPPSLFCFAEFGIVWGTSVFYRHEELTAKKTSQEKGPKNQNSMNGTFGNMKAQLFDPSNSA
jgi:hypothetical protein